MYPLPKLLLVEGNVTRNNFMEEWRMYESMTMPPGYYTVSVQFALGELADKLINEGSMARHTAWIQQELLVGIDRMIMLPSAPGHRILEVPYFVSSDLLGTRWTEYRRRLGELQEQHKLTDVETVNLLTEACSMHPKIQKYLCAIICPGTRVSKEKLHYLGSSWLLATMHKFAMDERAKIVACLEENSRFTTAAAERRTVLESNITHNPR
jgi:hypothetical protein